MDKIFSPEHWDRVLMSVEGRPLDAAPRNRRAERLWSAGYDAWHAENNPRAIELFRAAVVEEPGLADGYLGLYALSDGFDESICQALAHTAGRLRELQRRLDKRLTAYYFPLFFEPVPLSSPDDARLAFVRHLSKSGQFTAGQVWLARCNPRDSRTLALAGRMALDEGRYQDAVAHLQRVAAAGDELHGEAQLGIGIALEMLGLYTGAAGALRSAVKNAHHGHARRYARYRLARVYEQAGDEAKARRLLEQLYAEDARYLDVAGRLGLGASQEAPQEALPESPPADSAWRAIVTELESGRVVTDPSIRDNL